MIERLEYIKIKPDHIINIGGEQAALQALYPDAHILDSRFRGNDGEGGGNGGKENGSHGEKGGCGGAESESDEERGKNEAEGNGNNEGKKADLIFAILTSETEDISVYLTEWKEKLNRSGLLLFGFLNINFELRDIGDYLVHLGFVDVVMDREMLAPEFELICGHAFAPVPTKPISIPISQIGRHRSRDH